MAGAIEQKPKLVLITDEFPYSLREASFLRPELAAMKEAFYITLISKSASKQQLLEVDPEISVLHYDRPSPLAHLPYFFTLPFEKDFWQEWRQIRQEKAKKPLQNLLLSGYFIIEARFFSRYLNRQGLLNPADGAGIYYSYWNNYGLYALTRAKERGLLGSGKVVARTHGYDLYHERQPFGRQPVKQQTDRSLDRLYFISRQGMDYYLQHFSAENIPGKYLLSRLGTPDRGLSPIPEGGSPLKLLSLSNAVPVKRVERIIQALSLIQEIPISWVHYGDGPELVRLRSLADSLLSTKKNITFSLPGAVENSILMETLSQTPFHCLLNVSASEGLPVSVMEALSFGIPVLATAVGGTSELVSPDVGRLLPADVSPEEIASALIDLYRRSPEEAAALRHNARKTWEERCSEENFARFAKSLLELL